VKFTAELGQRQGLELMTPVLRPAGDLSAEYPLVFDEKGPGKLYALMEGDRVFSACAVLERELLHPGGRTSVGFIGSVSTHPDARGRGLATRLLGEVEAALCERGCEHALLWADDPGFYARRGYALDGTETDFLVDQVPATLVDSSFSVRALSAGDEERIHELYTWHCARTERTPGETKRLLACPEMRVLTAARGDEIEGYVCFGRGADLAGVVHEWGGSPESVLACLSILLERAAQLFVMAPGDAGQMGELLDSCGAIRAAGRLGMTKPLGEKKALPKGAFVWGLDSI
jgi:GNAT superfamily N-acetyltransferase